MWVDKVRWDRWVGRMGGMASGKVSGRTRRLNIVAQLAYCVQ